VSYSSNQYSIIKQHVAEAFWPEYSLARLASFSWQESGGCRMNAMKNERNAASGHSRQDVIKDLLIPVS
jgi:hypothetical protein